jgi:hypothetical protein
VSDPRTLNSQKPKPLGRPSLSCIRFQLVTGPQASSSARTTLSSKEGAILPT